MYKSIRFIPLVLMLVVMGLNAQVSNLTNPGNSPYASIQAAIDDAATVNGDVLEVSDGTYNENLIVNKELTIQSVNGASSTTISATGGTAILISADNVTITGFTISNPSGSYGITATGRNYIDITGNIITDIGSSSLSGPTYGVAIVMGSLADITDVNISNNIFSNINGGNNPALDQNTVPTGKSNNGSASAIAVGWSNADYSVTNLVIDSNAISDVNASTVAWDDGGKGSYGVLINVGGKAANPGQAVSPQITNNDISDLEGLWAHGIGLEGDTPGAVVTGNTIDDLTDYKSPSNPDAAAIMVEDNDGASTVIINDNSFTNVWLGVRNATSSTVNAKLNYWGSNNPDFNAMIYNTGGGSVSYSPWVSNDPESPHDSENPWTYNIDASNPDALDDVLASPTLIAGDIIVADGGTYTAVVIDEAITLIGTNGATLQNGSPALTISANNVTVDGFTFAYNTADYAIYVDGDYSGIVVKNCTFNNFDGGGVNPGFGIDNESSNTLFNFVDATDNNDWNGNGFPYNAVTSPTGTGVTISQYVQYNNVTLVSPVNSLSGVSIKPEFSWELTGADGYRVQIATSTDFVTDLVVEHSVGAGVNNYKFTGYFHPEIPLDNNTQYYWRVVAEYGATELSSSAWYFTTVSNVNISLWNPGNGMELYFYDPTTLTWSLNQAAGSLKFYVQLFEQGIAPDYVQIASFELTNAQNLGGNSAYYFENISDIYKNINGLNGGSKYYWYVCAYYDDGSTPNVLDLDDRIVKYSALYSFTTKGGAVKAYPSWPVGGYTIYDLEPTFYWYTMQYEPSSTYEVIYSTDNTVGGSGDLTVGTTTVSAGSNTFVPVGTTLDPSTQYYWQVKTAYGADVMYSSVASFTTYDAPGLVPTAATPSYPTGGLEIYTTAPTFYWYIQGYNVDVNFTVELSTDGGTTWPTTFGTTTNTYIQASGLIPGATYTWRVKSEKVGYTTVYSSPATFSVTGGLNSYPVASWPVGNPTVYNATPSLSWYMEGSTLGWTHYKVAWSGVHQADWVAFIGANPDSSYVTTDMNETFYTFTSPLEYGKKYYWAVVAHDHPSGPYSSAAEGSFTIAGNNASLVQLNPSNNIVINTKSPTFTWYVSGSLLGVTHYRLTYSKNELFNANVETVVTTSTSASVNSPLEEGTTYWWYVELSYDNGATYENPSSTWKFTVDPGASSVVPFAGSPARGITISSTSPVFSWYLPAQSSSALSYDLEIADNADFSNASVYSDIDDMNKAVENLSEGEYFWRVKSKTGNNESDYSAATSFKIGTVTDVIDSEELPLSYSIDQNYPNPFNPTTSINYSIPASNFVSIKVYDMLGQEVKTLINQEMRAGKHTLNWNGTNNYGYSVSSGTYIYRITAGEFVQTKKMILLK